MGCNHARELAESFRRSLPSTTGDRVYYRCCRRPRGSRQGNGREPVSNRSRPRGGVGSSQRHRWEQACAEPRNRKTSQADLPVASERRPPRIGGERPEAERRRRDREGRKLSYQVWSVTLVVGLNLGTAEPPGYIHETNGTDP